MANADDTTHPTEEWRPVPGWETYEVSNIGNVRSVDRTITDSRGVARQLRGRNLRPAPLKSGYLQVVLCRNNEDFSHYVHRLVASAFIGSPPENMVTCHNNGNPSDNRVENLRFDTYQENSLDMVRHGRNNVSKTHCPRNHVLEPPNLKPKLFLEKGYRDCLSCSRAWARIQKNPHLKPDFQKVSDSYYEKIMAE